MRRRLRTAAALLPWAALLVACGQAGAAPSAGRSTAVPPPVASSTGSAAPAGTASAPADGASPGATPPRGKPRTGPLAGKVITVDPGHNGANGAHPEIINRLVPAGPSRKPCNTTGTATDAGYSEHAYTFDVGTRLAAILRARGATVVLTRPNDHGVGPCVDQRAAIANKAHSDAALSIHADGAPARDHGFHVIVPAPIPGYTGPIVGPSRRLGDAVRDAFHSGTGQPYSNYVGRRGLDVRDDLGGLNLARVPAVFIECGNMHNRADAARLSDPAWRQRAAQALAAGLTAYLTR
ncbi:N-acetylmuramoyl-L-alanine amidase [Actinomadura scrupuli]|uniref:N-acetylmuramoyl-L-alanine amidase n=1 Tax=Actinomadura scrupuli TaxID=559629 RepID=UPI003D99FCDC